MKPDLRLGLFDGCKYNGLLKCKTVVNESKEFFEGPDNHSDEFVIEQLNRWKLNEGAVEEKEKDIIDWSGVKLSYHVKNEILEKILCLS